MHPDRLPRLILTALVLACAWPPVTAPMALGVGLLFGLMVRHPDPGGAARLSKTLLQMSVVGLGFGLNISQVWDAGRTGVIYTLVGIGFTLLLGRYLGRWLRVPSRTAALISVGTAICGGSAIAALAPVVEADDDEISVSLAAVFTLNAVALFVFPLIGHWVGLDQRQFGLWAALAIHDTSSVVGAGAVYGATALAVATTVKLARAAWIAPVTLFAAWRRGSRTRPQMPWFILGFLAAAVLRSVVPQGDPAWDVLSQASKRILVATLLLIGSGMTRQVLRRVGLRPMVQAVTLWIIVGSLTLGAILGGWVS